MKLIKLNSEHYIIVDDSEIDYDNEPYLLIKDDYETYIHKHKGDNKPTTEHYKITHSTQPLEFENVKVFDKEWEEGYFDKIQPLNLSEVKELLGEVDVEKKYYQYIGGKNNFVDGSNCDENHKIGFILGFNQALEDNKEYKFSESEMWQIFNKGIFIGISANRKDARETFENFISSLIQPQTEWEVEFIDGKLKLK